jgi:class 3 adenylate cyclase/tetratricopeptide (TPR) repeat protein
VKCGELNTGERRYCTSCGSILPGWCTSCGAMTTRRMLFCAACGAAIARGTTEKADGTQEIPESSDGREGRLQVAPTQDARWESTTETQHGAAAVREERRLVTALFCDLVGFTPLTERLDAEQVRELQESYFETMSEVITRFGGTVEKFAGDAVLALLGVPAAHEDDAEHAVRCALAMQEAFSGLAEAARRRYDVDLALRIGVNTGEAVSGLLDAGGRQDVAVTGDVVNTAARLQTAAPPGGIVIGSETARLVQWAIDLDPPEEVSLKGKSKPMAVYRVRGLRERPAERWETQRQRTPLVGRDRELETIWQVWDRVRGGEGQLLTLTAAAGVGKSRLIAEAVEQIAQSTEIRELRARCLSLGQNVSLWLIADLLRTLFGTREHDPAAQVRERITSAVEACLRAADEGAVGRRGMSRSLPDSTGDDGDTPEAMVDVLGEVLGLPSLESARVAGSAFRRRQILVRSLRLLLAWSQAASRPTVLVLEDLHWIDGGSAEVLAEILADVPQLPVLVLAAQRPGWQAPWNDWAWIERLNLHPLSDHDAVLLAQGALGNATISPRLEHYVSDRSGGNPFFVEELLHALQEAGGLVTVDGHVDLVPAAAERLPSSLTEILLARLDRLEADVRSLVQTASVIGRTFEVDLLARVADRSVEELQPPLRSLPRADIAFPRMGRESEYVFKHVNFRDVAYNTLLQRKRQALHLQTARALADLHQAPAGRFQTDEYVEVIAHHFAQTTAHQDAAHWLERAGDRSAGMFANQVAINHYEEARRRLELCAGDPLLVARVTEKLGRVFRIVAWYDEAVEELEEAARIYREAGDCEGEARAAALIGQAHFLRGAREEGIRGLQETLGRLQQTPTVGRTEGEDGQTDGVPASPGLVEMYVTLVDLLYQGNQFTDVLAAAEQALAIARRVRDERLVVEAETRVGRALQGVGRLDEGRRTLEAAMPVAESSGDLALLAQTLIWSGEILLTQGLPEQARIHYDRALKIDESRGDLAETAYLIGRIGQALFVLGDWPLAQIHFERAVELVRSISFSYFSAASLMTLGQHYLLCGDRDKAARYLEEPFTIAERNNQLDLLPYLQVSLADRDLREGRPADALERLRPLLAREPSFNTLEEHLAMQTAAEALLAREAPADGPDRAETILREGMSGAATQNNQLARLGWLRLDAMLAARRGNGHQASASFDEAVILGQSMPYPYAVARTLASWGAALIEQGQAREGSERLEAALAIFRRLGAAPNAEQVERALQAITV